MHSMHKTKNDHYKIIKDAFLIPGKAMGEELPEGYASSWDYGLDLACKRVAESRST